MPEWYLVMAAFALLSVLSLSWRPLVFAVPFFVWSLATPIAQAIASARSARFTDPPRSRAGRWRMHGLVAALHLMQPLARLRGRLRHGLTIWRQRGPDRITTPIARTYPLLVARWHAPDDRLRALQAAMKETGAVVLHGGDYDSWDLEVRGGFFGAARMQMATEDSGSGTQLVRVRTWPICHWMVPLQFGVSFGLAVAAAIGDGYVASTVLGIMAATIASRVLRDCGRATQAIAEALTACGLLDDGVTEPPIRTEAHSGITPSVQR